MKVARAIATPVIPLMGGRFSPRALFSSGEQGAWYDPSDFSTMFQDSAGTTPVTAVEQPVGLLLDKSKGLALGAELVTNGDFASGTGWTLTGANLSITGGKLVFSGTGATVYATQSILTIGKTYKITLSVSSYSAGSLRVYSGANASPLITANGTYTYYLLCTSETLLYILSTSGSNTFSVDDISVRELPGSHLSQSTAAARPVLSARVNLLTYTEQFDNAAWTKDGATVDPNAGVSPSGAMTADKLIEGTTVNGSNHRVYYNVGILTGTYTIVVLAKAAGRTKFHVRRPDGGDGDYVLFDLSAVSYTDYTGGVATASITSLDNGWYQCRVTAACVATAASFVHICLHADNGNRAYTGDGVSGILLGGADLRPANSGVGLPSYQRVGAATSGTSSAAGNADYDTTGFPLYLKFDGTDDFLQSSTITPGSVDKAQVFAGVRKLSDAAVATIAEYSATTASNAGSFGIFAPRVAASADYGSHLRGTARLEYITPLNFAAPRTDVLAAFYDIAQSTSDLENRVRINSVSQSLTVVDSQSGPAGTGNFGSHVLYVGARAGTSLRLNGQLYSLILRFSAANLDAATITATETWVNGKTRAF